MQNPVIHWRPGLLSSIKESTDTIVVSVVYTYNYFPAYFHFALPIKADSLSEAVHAVRSHLGSIKPAPKTVTIHAYNSVLGQYSEVLYHD